MSTAREQKPDEHEEFDLVELGLFFWRGKWLLLGSSLLAMLLSALYAFTQTNWYRSEIVVAPADSSSAPPVGGQLGSLVALAGLGVGGGTGASEALAILRSRDFIGSFIDDYDLMRLLFADDWDADAGRWISENEDTWPDIRDGIKLFVSDLLRVREDRDTRLIALSIDWVDPVVAAEWVTVLLERLNDRLRSRALRESRQNIEYLQTELASTNVLALQQSIGRLLEAELQKLMIARGNQEFALRIIDPAQVPKDPVRPNRALIVILGGLFGALAGTVVLTITRLIATYRARISRLD